MSKIATLLAKTRAAADQRERAAEDRYDAFVRQAAAGRELDPEDLAAFLDVHGFDVGAFQSDVERHAARLDARAKVDARPAHAKRLATATAKLEALAAKHQAAVEKLNADFAAACTPIEAERQEAERQVREADQAEQQLHGTAAGEARDRHAAAGRALGEARKQEAKLAAQLAEHPNRVAAAEREYAAALAGKPKFDDKRQQSHAVTLWERDLGHAARAVEVAKAAGPQLEQALATAREKVRAAEAEAAEAEKLLSIP